MIDLLRFKQHLHLLVQSLGVELPVSSYLLAYSGGLDSHVLLHLCHESGLPIRAIHVHHGLQSHADAWAEHCAHVCAHLGIDFKLLHVNAEATGGDSPEDAARKVRYAALADAMNSGECLLTAHHADDQAETLLLQLMRGAGAAGLAAMPATKTFAAGWHCRPLLACDRSDILRYAQAEKLRWIEDPSNQNTDFDRNLLRQKFLPILQQRWPSVAHSLSRSAELQQESLELNEVLAQIDLAAVSTADSNVLSIQKLQQFSRARQLNVLRFWLRLCTARSPSRNILMQLVDSLLCAAPDTSPLLKWGDQELRCYRQQLYLLPESDPGFTDLNIDWDGKSFVQIGERHRVSIMTPYSPGIDMCMLDHKLSLRFRQPGARIQLHGKSHHQDLKKLMQEAGIPPWQRGRIPLLYIDDQLACVCGYWLAEPFAARHGNAGWLPVYDEIEQA